MECERRVCFHHHTVYTYSLLCSTPYVSNVSEPKNAGRNNSKLRYVADMWLKATRRHAIALARCELTIQQIIIFIVPTYYECCTDIRWHAESFYLNKRGGYPKVTGIMMLREAISLCNIEFLPIQYVYH